MKTPGTGVLVGPVTVSFVPVFEGLGETTTPLLTVVLGRLITLLYVVSKIPEETLRLDLRLRGSLGILAVAFPPQFWLLSPGHGSTHLSRGTNSVASRD